MKTFLFELCVESLEAGRVAEAAGADQIELCADLKAGGVTPSFGLLEATIDALSIPVHVLIRPRSGDFAFSADEFRLMRTQIELASSAGAAGIATGVLLPDGRVDVERTRELVDLARPMKVTFHRAFDETPDQMRALEDVILCGVNCLLTSGGEPDVLAGAESIARLRRRAGERLDVMAGGGLRLEIVEEVLRRTGVSHMHGSLTRRAMSRGVLNGERHGNGGSGVPLPLEADVREAVRLLQLQQGFQEQSAS
jgi:copper homeostasis protein